MSWGVVGGCVVQCCPGPRCWVAGEQGQAQSRLHDKDDLCHYVEGEHWGQETPRGEPQRTEPEPGTRDGHVPEVLVGHWAEHQAPRGAICGRKLELP